MGQAFKLKRELPNDQLMTKYDIPVWKMVYEATKELPLTFRAIDVINKVREKRPEVKKNTIRCHVMGMTPNHSSSKHYSGRYKLFHFMGDGNYRLLPKDKIVFPSMAQKLEAGKKVDISKPVGTVEMLLNMGEYILAIREFGLELENLLSTLHRNYFYRLPIECQEKIISYKKDVKKSTDRFTLGEWIGLFREAGMFKYIAEDKGKKDFIFFTSSLLDTLNKLRNRATHKKKDENEYLNRETAFFAKWAMKCIIHELGS